MKKAILIGIALAALLALAAPVYADGGGNVEYDVCPILPISYAAAYHNQANFQEYAGEYYLCPGVFVTVPLLATNLNGFGELQGSHASPPWRQEGYTPIWAAWGE